MREYPTHTWPRVLERSRKRAEREPQWAPMRDLVERIAASPYAAGLHPMLGHELRLSPHERFNLLSDEVRIALEGGEFVVRYKGGPTAATWTTRDRDGFAALERFLHHIRWFVEYRAAPSDGPAA